jgi:hypothetical protein
MRRNRAVTVVLLLGMLLGSGAWATACPEGDTGAGSAAGQGKPIVELPKEARKIKFRVTWEPADSAVQIWTALDGHPVDHGVKRGGSWGIDGIATNSAGVDARALNHPDSLHCDLQVGWTHEEGWAAPDKGDWTCFAHWTASSGGLSMKERKP